MPPDSPDVKSSPMAAQSVPSMVSLNEVSACVNIFCIAVGISSLFTPKDSSKDSFATAPPLSKDSANV